MRWMVGAAISIGCAACVYLGYRWVSTPTLTVTTAIEGPVVEAFYATGTLSPHRDHPIRAAVEGTLTQVSVDKGSRVKAGDMLAMVRVESFEMRLRQTRADLELAQARADEATSPVLAEFDAQIAAAREQQAIAEREYQRVLGLFDAGSASQSDLDRASERRQSSRSATDSLVARRRARRLELERDLEIARAANDIARWNIDEQTLRSPIDGVVLDRPLSHGSRVRVNDPIMTIADVRPVALLMRAQVDEEDKTRIAPGQRVVMTLFAYGDRVFEGRVRQVYPRADPDRRTFEVDVTIDPIDDRFSAGMTGELAFIVESRQQATVVPTQAVQGGTIYTIRQGRLLAVEGVTLGLRSIERTEVTTGLSPGEEVVVSSVTGIAPGTLVRRKSIDPMIAAGLNRPGTYQDGGTFKGF